MTNLDLVSAVVGTLMPPVVAVINQPRWPSWARGVAMVAVCVVAGGATAAASGDLNGLEPLRAVGVVLVATLGAYHGWWKPSGIAGTVERLTAVGTVEGRHEEPAE